MLLLAAIGSAPWHGISYPAILWELLGLGGLLYVVIVARRMRIQQAYSPQFEDWLFHVMLPCLAYGTLMGSGYATRLHDGALFAIGAASLLLLFAGIHNAWDAVTYHVVIGGRTQRRGEP